MSIATVSFAVNSAYNITITTSERHRVKSVGYSILTSPSHQPISHSVCVDATEATTSAQSADMASADTWKQPITLEGKLHPI
jgi:hypothetical protein